MKLYGYWRSTAAYRVRIALALKGVDVEQAMIDLHRGDQSAPAFKALNPQGVVPALAVGDRVLVQSLAIIEWLEEVYPAPALLPADPFERAHVRAMASLVASDIQPLNSSRVLARLRQGFAADEPATRAWVAAGIQAGFAALESLLGDRGWSFGDQPSLADCCVVPQAYSARVFGVDLEPYPRIRRVATLAAAHPAFLAAHPDRQADAPVGVA